MMMGAMCAAWVMAAPASTIAKQIELDSLYLSSRRACKRGRRCEEAVAGKEE